MTQIPGPLLRQYVSIPILSSLHRAAPRATTTSTHPRDRTVLGGIPVQTLLMTYIKDITHRLD